MCAAFLLALLLNSPPTDQVHNGSDPRVNSTDLASQIKVNLFAGQAPIPRGHGTMVIVRIQNVSKQRVYVPKFAPVRHQVVGEHDDFEVREERTLLEEPLPSTLPIKVIGEVPPPPEPRVQLSVVIISDRDVRRGNSTPMQVDLSYHELQAGRAFLVPVSITSGTIGPGKHRVVARAKQDGATVDSNTIVLDWQDK